MNLILKQPVGDPIKVGIYCLQVATQYSSTVTTVPGRRAGETIQHCDLPHFVVTLSLTHVCALWSACASNRTMLQNPQKFE